MAVTVRVPTALRTLTGGAAEVADGGDVTTEDGDFDDVRPVRTLTLHVRHQIV